MTIEVTGCHDCPFSNGINFCNQTMHFIWPNFINNTIEESCPLKQETITIKLKEDDTTDND